MPFKAVTFDAYGTLLKNQGVIAVARRIVVDHRLTVPSEEVSRCWIDLYCEATQQIPFRTLRQIHGHILPSVLPRFDVQADVARFVDLFFQVTTQVELYPETRAVLDALRHVRCAILSNADHEHLAAWHSLFPMEGIVISEAVQAYKPHPVMFQRALERLRVEPDEVLHVGDSDVDDVKGAKATGLHVAWVNRDGRARRVDVPAPDFEIPDLTALPALVGFEPGPRVNPIGSSINDP
jgi:2-haloalkanoic acid dehalogenase type II